MKECTKCGVVKASQGFSASKSARDGLQHHCKDCNAAYYAEKRQERDAYRARNREALYSVRRANRERLKGRSDEESDADFQRLRGPSKACRSCKVVCPIGGFNRHRITEDGRRAKCRRCENISRLERQYPKLQDYWISVGIDWTKCAYCKSESPTDRDHFYPVAKGGNDDYGNLFPACRNCNRGIDGRFDKNPWAWLQSRFPNKIAWFKEHLKIEDPAELVNLIE